MHSFLNVVKYIRKSAVLQRISKQLLYICVRIPITKTQAMKQRETMRRYITFLLLVGGLLSAEKLAGRAKEPVIEAYAFKQYTTQDGLPKMYTECVFQDSKRFLWVGTLRGAVRFDGFRFEPFGITGDVSILFMRESRNKRLMAFGREAYYLFDDATKAFIRKEYPPQLTISEWNSRLMPDGYAMFRQVDGSKVKLLLCRIADEEIVPLTDDAPFDGMSDSQGPYFDEKRQLLYIPCYESGIIKGVTLDGKTRFSQKIKAPYALFKFREALYCVAEDGLYRQNGERFEGLLRYDFPPSYGVIKTAVDANGDLIISNMKDVLRFRDKRLELIFNGANLLTDICIDHEGNLWLATYQGVYNLFRQQFKNYTLRDTKDMFRVIAGLPTDGGIVAGTFDGKLLAITPDGSRGLPYPSNPQGEFFENYCGATSDALYLPAAGDVLRYTRSSTAWLHLPASEYRCVATMPDGNMIAGWKRDFVVFTPDGKVVRRLRSDDVQQNGQSRPCFDSKNALYIGGDKGVTKITADGSTLIAHPDFPDCIVLRSDNEGRIWGGSRRRLFRLVDNKIVLFRELKGEITNLFFTRRNQLIAGTTQGVYVFDSEHKTGVLYDGFNGYTLIEPVRCDMYEDAEGNVWMPSVGGIARFNPQELFVTQPSPVLHLTLANSSFDNIHWAAIGDPDRLTHSQRHIQFHYIGLSYAQAQNLRYHYRLLGFQNEWSEPDAQRSVTFNNLPPSDYRFELYAEAGRDDLRSDIQSFAFTIKPAFWQQTWFLVLGIAALILASISITLAVQRRRNRLEMEGLRSEKELNELRINSIRLKAIPHFNANVLAAIEYQIANRSKADAMQTLGIYSDYTLKTLMELDKAARPLSDELDYARMYLNLEKIRFRDKFVVEIDIADTVDRSVLLPNMILHTYCENAIKHGLMPLKTGGRLTIRASQTNGRLRIEVEDNGVGRTNASHNPLLRSTKQGLSILDRQIEIYNRFNSRKIVQHIDDLCDADGSPTGTRFSVEVPIDFVYMETIR